MVFVTKKEFEEAIKVIQKACTSGQVVRSLYEQETIPLPKVFFSCDDNVGFSPNEITFTPPEQAIKKALFDLRKLLNAQKEQVLADQKVLEALEKNEKNLINLLQVHKE